VDALLVSELRGLFDQVSDGHRCPIWHPPSGLPVRKVHPQAR
jgi:hypothetical protein